MTEDSGAKSDEVDTQRAYEMIHRDCIAHIAAMKVTQWKVTHFAVLLLAVLFYFSTKKQALVFPGPLLITIGGVAILIAWSMIMWRSLGSLANKRTRLNKLYGKFADAPLGIYGEIDSCRERRCYDSDVTVCLGITVLVGVALTIASACTGMFVGG